MKGSPSEGVFYLQLHALIAGRGKNSHSFVFLLIKLNGITQPRCKKAPEDSFG